MPSTTARIFRLLKANTLMTISELSDEMNHRARSSLFRDLQKISTTSSYTHAGKYHALESTPNFDSAGLWFYQGIGFSKYNTLKATILNFIESSSIGKTHKELNDLLKIKTHNTLKQLVDTKQILRKQMPNSLYVYLHGDKEKSKQQFELRLSMKTGSLTKISAPPQSATIAVLAELIRHHRLEAEPNLITNLLKQSGLDINIRTVEHIFAYYQIKKNRSRNHKNNQRADRSTLYGYVCLSTIPRKPYFAISPFIIYLPVWGKTHCHQDTNQKFGHSTYWRIQG